MLKLCIVANQLEYVLTFNSCMIKGDIMHNCELFILKQQVQWVNECEKCMWNWLEFMLGCYSLYT